FGGILIKHAGYVRVNELIASFRKRLLQEKRLIEEDFDFEKIIMTENEVLYKSHRASKIIFCEGPLSKNPWFRFLKFRPVRGEIMDIECNLPRDWIINQGVFIIPKDGFCTVGATYDHQILEFKPQESGISILEDRLKKLYGGTYTIRSKRAGVRPATFDRKPFIGLHPNHKTLGIFNGFGSKGVSLAPYFARYFVKVLEGATTVDPEVDVQRSF
ncbi:MAG: FAD-dependent oxidoreductase, partial [Bacteroidota bacterium]